MAATAAAVGEYFAAAGETATVAEGATAATAAGSAGTAATAASAGTVAAGGSTALGSVGTVAAQTAATALVAKALTPSVDRPDLPKPIAMPDAQAQEAARKRSLIEQFSRGGRASTVLTNPVASSGKLGG